MPLSLFGRVAATEWSSEENNTDCGKENRMVDVGLLRRLSESLCSKLFSALNVFFLLFDFTYLSQDKTTKT